MGNLLIIDDDEMMCKAFSKIIKDMGHDVEYALTLDEGLERASSDPFDVVLLDVRMPDGSGLEILPKIKRTTSKPEVIIMTAAGDPDGAELAIKSGAWDYIEKAPSLKEMMLPLSRAFQYMQEKAFRTPPVALKREGLVGNSPKIKVCLDLVAQAAVSDANILITGETGTGKELFARAIHDNSRRSEKNFVVIDCAALPETLVQSLLFGHEKGAFTSADKYQQGLIEQADVGTLFLDEIGELSLVTQRTFFRVLQERRFRSVGGKAEKKSNFRLIAATNRNLDQMAEKGDFRKDLLFRLHSLTIDLPSLRDRLEDIKELARFHVSRLCDYYHIETKGFSPEFFDALTSYNWPGNVRELVNMLDGAIAVAGKNPTLYSKHLPTHIRIRMARTSIGKYEKKDIPPNTGINPAENLPDLKTFRESVERQYLKDLILLTKGDIKKSCQISGISRSRLYEILAKYKITVFG
ncbi:MAG: sigma-54 dependent transcriptional regulator [Desulfobacterales bacterium]|nr:sigma-54 dependent transcriptional regulator [Desulfobacterales bacterium]